jgi:cell division protein ZapA
MATVTVEINGRPYAVGCADGQEVRVRSLAAEFDGHVRQVAKDVGQVGEIRLFLMAALLLSDELHEARAQVAGGASAASGGDGAAAERLAFEALTRAAERIEALAAE